MYQVGFCFEVEVEEQYVVEVDGFVVGLNGLGQGIKYDGVVCCCDDECVLVVECFGDVYLESYVIEGCDEVEIEFLCVVVIELEVVGGQKV